MNNHLRKKVNSNNNKKCKPNSFKNLSKTVFSSHKIFKKLVKLNKYQAKSQRIITLQIIIHKKFKK